MDTVNSLRRSARGVAGELEGKLLAYGAMVAAAQRADSSASLGTTSTADDLEGGGSGGAAAFASADALEHEISSLLDQYAQLVGVRMDACLASCDAEEKSGAVFARRLRDGLQQDRAEFCRMRGSLQRRRDRAELFGSLGGSARSKGAGGGGDAQSQLLRERTSIRSASSGASSVIEQAQETHRALRTQRSVFVAARHKLDDVSRTFPRVGKVIDAIKSKRNRDTIVIGFVIACCIFFLFWWTILR
jgi:hypothetical protein